MHDVLAAAQPGVQRDGGIVPVVGLHEDDPGAAFARDPAELRDQRGRDALATMRLGDGEVVEIDLAALLLVLAMLVGDQAADHLVRLHGGDRDEGVAGKQPLQAYLQGYIDSGNVTTISNLQVEGEQVSYDWSITRNGVPTSQGLGHESMLVQNGLIVFWENLRP